ncbi:alpha/beta fold hydrolase [Nocardia sp. NBC_01329]|uniref:alpha/beta fold hydrolase n=1 Tax=Nocardia sp. NBC_01329 TaxID=2903594 RepID=UPI002E0DB6FE|nr:alpha/beta fold hydrolase [Nocardia sp. NBC_01329]
MDIPTELGTLRVRVTGSGPAMLLWPSLLMDHTLWDAQVAYFSPRFTTIAVDPPGHGASTPLARPFTFEECARCVLQILDALGIDRAHFVGNSWGAMIGATFGAVHPERVLTAVLMNGTATPAGMRQRLEFRALLAFARILGGYRGPLTRSALSAFLGPTTMRTRPDVVARVRHTVRANDVGSTRHAVHSVVIRRPDQRQLLDRIRTPTAVVGGRQDSTFPPAEVEELARSVPGAELSFLEDGHLLAVEVPDQVNSLIDDFLRRHEPHG